jgi:Ca2+-binding EF-hand superfamily protein
VRRTHRLLGVAALVMMMGSGIAMADGDTQFLPLQGPISFEAFDLDGSGAISEQEFDQVRARRAEAREKAGLSPPRQSRSFSSIDSDGDGAITREELEAAHGAAGAGPGQGPGMQGGRGRGMGGGPPAFSDFDLNGDGAISEQEFIDARTKRIAERVREGRMMRGLPTAPSFADRDTDGDGILTPDEFAAGIRTHQERMGGEAPAGAGP